MLRLTLLHVLIASIKWWASLLSYGVEAPSILLWPGLRHLMIPHHEGRESMSEVAERVHASMLLISTKMSLGLKGWITLERNGSFFRFFVSKQLYWDYIFRLSCKYLVQKMTFLHFHCCSGAFRFVCFFSSVYTFRLLSLCSIYFVFLKDCFCSC